MASYLSTSFITFASFPFAYSISVLTKNLPNPYIVNKDETLDLFDILQILNQTCFKLDFL